MPKTSHLPKWYYKIAVGKEKPGSLKASVRQQGWKSLRASEKSGTYHMRNNNIVVQRDVKTKRELEAMILKCKNHKDINADL